MFWERQLFQHDDRLHDMVVDFEAFLFRQRSAADRQVVHFTQIVFMFWHIKLETVGIVVRRRRFGGVAVYDVIIFVRQQVLHYRHFQFGGSVLSFLFLVGNADPVTEGSSPLNFGNGLGIRHPREFESEGNFSICFAGMSRFSPL